MTLPWSSFASELFWFLTKQSLFAAALFVPLVITHYLTPKASAELRYTLWSLLWVRFILPPFFAHPFSLYQFLAPYFTMPERHFSGVIFSNDPAPIIGPSFDAFSIGLNAPGHIDTWQLFVLGFWGAGMLYMAVLFYVKRLRCRRLVRNAIPVQQPDVLAAFDDWVKRLRLRRRPRLVWSDELRSGFAVGFFNPVIVLPRGKLSEAMLAHEMVHIKRNDDFWIILQNIIQILFFFHPAVWFANDQIHLARECICDQRVLAERKVTRNAYGQSLIASLKSALFDAQSTHTLPAFVSSKSILTTRIRNLKGDRNMKKSEIYALKLGFVLGVLFLLPMSGVSKHTASTGHAAVRQSNKTIFSLPLPKDQYRVTAPFGKMLDPFTKEERMHRGIDLKAKLGTDVYSAAEGTVINVNFNVEKGEGSGIFLEIQHADGFATRYTHLNEILVAEGQRIQQGQVIAKVGSSGRSTGPHLHFELWQDGVPVNPAGFLSF